MAKVRIDTVVFDLGGVLVQIARGWDDAHRLAGLDADHPGLDSEKFREHGPVLANAHQRGEITPEEWAAGIAETSGGSYSAEEAMRIMDAWTIEEYPGIAEVIDAIHDAGLATAALSNTNARHWELLGPATGDFSDYPNLERLGQLLAGTKFHRLIQMRGQQGIGASGATMLSQMTTGKATKVISFIFTIAIFCNHFGRNSFKRSFGTILLVLVL